MKKIMIAVAIVCAAAFAQAATVNWCTGTIYAPGEGGTGYAVGDVYLPASTGDYTIQLLVSATYDSATDSLGSLFTFTGGDTGSVIQDGGYAEGVATGLTDGDNIWYGQMIVTEVATGSTLTSEVFSFEVTSASGKGEPYVGDGGMSISLAKGGELDATYGAWSTSGWQSVPEPTSGLLLLIGVAGLALKRKRA